MKIIQFEVLMNFQMDQFIKVNGHGQKYGKGEFYQKDGSLYEGYFKTDMFN